MSREALLAGKHVLVEKPMAMNAAEVADLFGLAAARGVFLMEAMWMKFTPGFLRLREEIARGRIGEVRSVRAAFGAPFPRRRQPLGSRGERRRATRSGNLSSYSRACAVGFPGVDHRARNDPRRRSRLVGTLHVRTLLGGIWTNLKVLHYAATAEVWRCRQRSWTRAAQSGGPCASSRRTWV